MSALFGVAGMCNDFMDAIWKRSAKFPEYLKENGLSIYEYQCGNSLRLTEKTAVEIGKAAHENGIIMTVHAPYFIVLSSIYPEKRVKSIKYITDTLEIAKYLKAKRIILHTGTCAKISRIEAMGLAKDTLTSALAAADSLRLGDINICLETMGKINQLGTVDEVIELCKLDERLIPCIDFGHINARTLGGLQTKADFEQIFDALENELGGYRATNFHIHYSRIEFTKGGEKMHHTFADAQYGPEFEPIAEIIAERGLSPMIICESNETQTRDAVQMQKIYKNYIDKKGTIITTND